MVGAPLFWVCGVGGHSMCAVKEGWRGGLGFVPSHPCSDPSLAPPLACRMHAPPPPLAPSQLPPQTYVLIAPLDPLAPGLLQMTDYLVTGPVTKDPAGEFALSLLRGVLSGTPRTRALCVAPVQTATGKVTFQVVSQLVVAVVMTLLLLLVSCVRRGYMRWRVWRTGDTLATSRPGVGELGFGTGTCSTLTIPLRGPTPAQAHEGTSTTQPCAHAGGVHSLHQVGCLLTPPLFPQDPPTPFRHDRTPSLSRNAFLATPASTAHRMCGWLQMLCTANSQPTHTRPRANMQAYMPSQHAHLHSHAHAHAHTLTRMLTLPAPQHLTDAGAASVPPPRRALIVTAAVNYFLTAYSTFTVAAVKLMHCVSVPGTPPGSTARLLIQGSLTCDLGGWRSLFVLVLVLLCLVPGVVLGAAAWAVRPPPSSGPPHAAAPVPASPSSPLLGPRRGLLVQDVQWGVRRALVDPYRGRWYGWEAVLMLQRLVGYPTHAHSFTRTLTSCTHSQTHTNTHTRAHTHTHRKALFLPAA
jgi:hypothetical protein